MSDDNKSGSDGWMTEKVSFSVPRWVAIGVGLVLLLVIIY